jgi:hypothetical protein
MTTFNAYLMNTYPLYCASALASTILLRSTFAAAFPLFSGSMFRDLGDQWASSVFAFLALACTPVPLLFFVRRCFSGIFSSGDLTCVAEIREMDTFKEYLRASYPGPDRMDSSPGKEADDALN